MHCPAVMCEEITELCSKCAPYCDLRHTSRSEIQKGMTHRHFCFPLLQHVAKLRLGAIVGAAQRCHFFGFLRDCVALRGETGEIKDSRIGLLCACLVVLQEDSWGVEASGNLPLPQPSVDRLCAWHTDNLPSQSEATYYWVLQFNTSLTSPII